MVFIPFAGMDVQPGDSFSGELLLQTLAQQIAKKMVIAVPAPLVIERNDEQIRALEIFQGRLP